jgi:hypothetical protein
LHQPTPRAIHSSPSADFAEHASDEQITTTTNEAPNANHIQTVMVDSAEDAR